MPSMGCNASPSQRTESEHESALANHWDNGPFFLVSNR